MLLLVWVAADARGAEPGITFATNGIDLKIDSHAFYNGNFFPTSSWYLKDLNPWKDHFFDFDDVKPGDWGKTIISMHVKKTDAWMCLDFKNLKSNDNGQNEPESHDDLDGNTDGELAENLFFFAWRDDGDNTFEVGETPIFGNTPLPATTVLNETTYPIADAGNGSSCKEGTTRYVGLAWCAGIMSVNLATAQISCDGSQLGNVAQTDSMSVDVSIRAVPTKQNPNFKCNYTPPPPEEKKGSIKVCKVITDKYGKFVTGSDYSGTTFSIPGISFAGNATAPQAVALLPTSNFTTPLTLNADLFGSDGKKDAQCVTYSDLKLGSYYYDKETINSTNWLAPKYSDSKNPPLSGTSNLATYSGQLFTPSTSDDASRNQNADGHILLSKDNPNRTLIILNSHKVVKDGGGSGW